MTTLNHNREEHIDSPQSKGLIQSKKLKSNVVTLILNLNFSLTSVTDFLTTSREMGNQEYGLTLLDPTTDAQVLPVVYGFHQSNALIFPW